MDAREYRQLLRLGTCSGEEALGYNSDEELRVWHDRVAEPWFAAIRAQAESDGLRVMTYDGWDNMGMGWVSPAAVLLRRDGSQYGSKMTVLDPNKHELMMPADWGDLLTDARKRHGLPAITIKTAPFPPDPVGFMLEFLRMLWRFVRVVVFRRELW